jgi:hypothetical protein
MIRPPKRRFPLEATVARLAMQTSDRGLTDGGTGGLTGGWTGGTGDHGGVKQDCIVWPMRAAWLRTRTFQRSLTLQHPRSLVQIGDTQPLAGKQVHRGAGAPPRCSSLTCPARSDRIGASCRGAMSDSSRDVTTRRGSDLLGHQGRTPTRRAAHAGRVGDRLSPTLSSGAFAWRALI